jgi:hypothetical protein
MRVRFVVSLPYNMVMMGTSEKEFGRKDLQKVIEWSKIFEIEWRKHEKSITDKISKYSGFEWQNEDVVCFVVENFPIAGISLPLTIRMGEVQERIKTLTHELIHVNISRKFKNLIYESKKPRTFTHIALYLIYHRITSEIFPRDEPYSEFELKGIYREAIKKSIELEPLWRKSNRNMFDFMKYCLKRKLVP